jgi:hypothetical protein
MDWLSAGLSLLNKAIPERKEDLRNAITALEEFHGQALSNFRLILAARIRKRINQLKGVYNEM